MSTKEDIEKSDKLESEYRGFTVKQLTLLNMVEMEKIGKKVDVLMEKNASDDIKNAVFNSKLGFILTISVMIISGIVSLVINLLIE